MSLSQSKKIFACFVDFNKAFDTVWRKGLLYKLAGHGVGEKFFHVIKSMYKKTNSCIKFNTFNSNYFDILRD